MLAKPVDRLPSEGDWRYELKLDGYRTPRDEEARRLVLYPRTASFAAFIPTLRA
jgi:ATP-dependent DNA ligase